MDLAGLIGTGSEQPNATGIGEISSGVNKRIDEIFVVSAVPEENDIAELIGVLVEQSLPDHILDRLRNRRVAVVVPTELLDNLVLLNTELVHVVCGTSGAHYFHFLL